MGDFTTSFSTPRQGELLRPTCVLAFRNDATGKGSSDFHLVQARSQAKVDGVPCAGPQ
jgi:hypothetical protein